MGIFETLISWDKETLLALNGMHNIWMDRFMWLMSQTYVWVPFYIFFLYQVIRLKKAQSLLFILMLALLITFADQIASGVFKPLVARFRPTHDPQIQHLIHTVRGYRGGNYGFFSSHAANMFAFASFSLLWLRNNSYTCVVLLWAGVVAYSRIYLGVHFPLDVLTGIVFGSLSGWLFYTLYLYFSKQKGGRGTRSNRMRGRSTGKRTPEGTQLAIFLFSMLVISLLTSYFLAW